MKQQESIEQEIRDAFGSLGQDPADIVSIIPTDGGWGNALSYEVVRKDGARTRVSRRALDDNDGEGIRSALRHFQK